MVYHRFSICGIESGFPDSVASLNLLVRDMNLQHVYNNLAHVPMWVIQIYASCLLHETDPALSILVLQLSPSLLFAFRLQAVHSIQFTFHVLFGALFSNTHSFEIPIIV